MKEIIENMKTVLLDGMPNLFHGIPLSQLPESHPEVLTQKVLVAASKKYIANPIDIARAMVAALAGSDAVLTARRANSGDGEWNHDHRFMLRRLTLAIMRYMHGPGTSFELNEVDESLFAVLILDDEVLEEHPELAFNPSLH